MCDNWIMKTFSYPVTVARSTGQISIVETVFVVRVYVTVTFALSGDVN